MFIAPRLCASSHTAIASISDENCSEALDDASQNTKKAVTRLNLYLKSAKSEFEKQVYETEKLLDSLCINLKTQEETIESDFCNLSLSQPVKQTLNDVLKNARTKLDGDLEKLQETFNCNQFGPAVQIRGRSIIKDTLDGFNTVVNAIIRSNEKSDEAIKVIQDFQQLIKWTYEVLTPSFSALTEKSLDMNNSFNNTLDLMENIYKKIKLRNRDKRMITDLKTDLFSTYREVEQLEEANRTSALEKPPEHLKEEGLEELFSSKDLIQNLLFDIKENISGGHIEDAEDQIKSVADTVIALKNSIRLSVAFETDNLKAQRLIDDMKELVEQVSELMESSESLQSSSNEQKEKILTKCDAIDDHLEEMIGSIEAAADNEKIIAIFREQTEKVNDCATEFKEEPNSDKLQNLSTSINRVIKSLRIMLEKETHPDLQVVIETCIDHTNLFF